MTVSPGILLRVLVAIALFVPAANSQQISRLDRELSETMLDNVSSDVHKYYFDAKLHGLDWDELVNQTRLDIDKAPDSGVANAEIAALLERLNDSHTRFFPPRNTVTADYGWRFKIIGKRCFVTQVSPGSDAERQGMRAGDEVFTINGFAVDRAGAPLLEYAMKVLMPQSRLQVEMRDPTGKLLHLTVGATVKKHPTISNLGGSSWNSNQRRIDAEDAWYRVKARYKELGPDLMILRIPAFVETDSDVDDLFKKARSHKTLIVDLRGTPGGMIHSVVNYLEDVFTKEVKVGNWVERDKIDPLTVKGNRKGAFTGDLIVLVDSETASAAEIFARVVQLQERGTILGDHSSGRTMESRVFVHRTGFNPVFAYGDSVTVADTVMSDGKSLEHVGVEPDRVFLPTVADIAVGRDPLLAYAAGLAGVKLSPEDAAKLFRDPDEQK
ncbi:MAG: S41 family peptidase [Terracidiphilus sp.]